MLHVVHYPMFGGPHNQALRLAAPLRQRGWDTIVLLPEEPGNAANRLSESGVEVISIPLRRMRATRSLLTHLRFVTSLPFEVHRIRRVIRSHSISIVQVAGLVNPHAAMAARLERVPVVWQLLDTRAPAVVGRVATWLVRRLATVVMSTGTSILAAHSIGPEMKDRVYPYFPPVDTELFRPRPDAKAEVRAAWGVSGDRRVVGCVANLNPQKGIIDLVRAFSRSRKRVPDARLVIVGAEHSTHAAYAAQVRASISDAGMTLGRDVILAGPMVDIERQLAGFDVFAFTPDRRGEGVSTVVLEAMASALPVVAYDVAGLSEAITDRVSGRLVAAGDWTLLGDVVADLLESPAEAQKLGIAARLRAEETFDLASCADVHSKAYRHALRASTGSAALGR